MKTYLQIVKSLIELPHQITDNQRGLEWNRHDIYEALCVFGYF